MSFFDRPWYKDSTKAGQGYCYIISILSPLETQPRTERPTEAEARENELSATSSNSDETINSFVMDNTLLRELGLKYDTPLAMLTLGQLLDVMDRKGAGMPVKQEGKKFLHGLKGIADRYGVSKKTACEWCKGWLAPAVEKRGNTIICDQDLADELFAGRK